MIRIDRGGLDALFQALKNRGFEIVGPRLRDAAIVYDRLDSTADLPVGWTDRQERGSYHLRRRSDEALFGYAVGPHSWKKYLLPPLACLWRARRDENGVEFFSEEPRPEKLALIGVRSCEIHAIAIQDKVLMGGKVVDPIYAAQRENLFIIAVQCAEAGGTCFCVSMKTGPKATFGFDIALTEVLNGEGHYFTAEGGTPCGEEVLLSIPCRDADSAEREAAERVVERTARQMGRAMDSTGIKELLYGNLEHPRWDDVAARCLACGNCTMVCPTCFCTNVQEVSDLKAEETALQRRWDSCFTMDFSFIHGGSVRSSHKARFRQWMTHKLATWIDQFGTSGCVGCGRCITWCPVGIDLTEEVRAIRAPDPERGP